MPTVRMRPPLPMDSNLVQGFDEAQAVYSGPTQNARVLSESWILSWGFCPNCGQGGLDRFQNNNPGADFSCRTCKEVFELKCKNGQFGPRILDGAFRSMQERLLSDATPNLMLMTYNIRELAVRNLFVVPKHFFTPELIQERKPLPATARRAGWIGCNILLKDIPESGRVFMIRDGRRVNKDEILTNWQRTLFLKEQAVTGRGWLIEVMRCIDTIGRPEFSLDEIYAFEPRLCARYPENNHVRPKIRQQLQVLRDSGYLEFQGRGQYRLK